MNVQATSRIDKVVVHARGALVTREVLVPAELPAGEVDLIVPGLTLLAWPGSLRAQLSAEGRQVVSAQLGLQVPASTALAAPGAERLAELERRIERLRVEEAALQRRHAALLELLPSPSSRTLLIASDVLPRIGDGLAVAQLARELTASLDEQLLLLARELEDLELRRRAFALEEAQSSAEARRGQGQTTRQAMVRLVGQGPVAALQLTYAVPGARWWPASTLRFSGGGSRAQWELEAVVAQASGEDWSGVRLSLSTAQMLFDARLPELASIRFGRAQPARPTGYRPAPTGLLALFAGFDGAFPGGMPGLAAPLPPPPPMPSAMQAFRPPPSPPPAPVAPSVGAAVSEVFADLGAALPSGASEESSSSKRRDAPMPKAMMLAAPARGGGASMPRSAPGASGPVASSVPSGPQESLPTELEPASGWLDFDALALAGPEDRPRRGKLARLGADPAAHARDAAGQRVERIAPGQQLRDPAPLRGQFDHRYDAEAAVDVPADSLPHRVPLATAAAAPTLRLRTVPREAPEVYRQAELVNPFNGPLLGGPVNIYVEGTLLTTTAISGIDRGGRFVVGMGVEDRVRVARNVRADESSAGLLGGSTAITHSVSIELTSSLGREVTVEVLDRVPISDDADIKVERLDSQRPAEAFTQADAGAPLRGGLSWKVPIPAGSKAAVEHRYRITLPAKDELVGGNRRE